MNSAHIAYSQVDSPIAGIFDSKTGNLLARINLSPGKLGWFDRYFRINPYHSPRINLTITSGGTLVAIDKSSGNVFAWDEPVKSPEKRRKLRKSASVLFEDASKRHAEKLVRLLVLFVIYFLAVPKNIMFYYLLGVCALFVPFRFKQKRRAEQCLQDIVTAPDGSVILLYSTELLISDKSVAKIRKSIILPTPADSFSDMFLTTGSQGDVVVCYERNSVCQAWRLQDGKIGAQWQTEGSFEVVLGDKSEIVTITSSCLLQAWKGRKDELKTIESFPVNH